MECAAWARRLCPVPEKDHCQCQGVDHGLELAALLAYCSPPSSGQIDGNQLDPVLLDLVTAAADVPTQISWAQRTELQREPLEALRTELSRRLSATGHDLDRYSDPVAGAWRVLHTTPWTVDSNSLWVKEPYCFLIESSWDEPGQTPLGHGVLQVHRWLEQWEQSAPARSSA